MEKYRQKWMPRIASLCFGIAIAALFANCRQTIAEEKEQTPKSENIVWLDELDHGKIASSEGDSKQDLAFGAYPLTLGGQVFERGVGLRAPASLRLLLSEGTERFTALVGIGDEVASSTT